MKNGIEMKYTPNPIQTDDISLSDDLVALTELIAANVHDVWAAGRIKEGWTYGKNKDTEKKTTPCLVPYDELPEFGKEYDRNTAVETLKLITKRNGCSVILHPQMKAPHFQIIALPFICIVLFV